MKSVLHPDGKRRITMKMEVAVDVETLTMYALDMLKTEADPVALVQGCNKREIFALARANIQSYGRDTALQNVPQALTPVQIAAAQQHVQTQFKEID